MRTLSLIPALLVMAAVSAQAAEKNPLAGSHDNHAPIEINSDALEVLQEQNKAIFKGHVVAIQQEVRLKADVMTVFYTKKNADAKTKKAQPEDAMGSGIEKIEAEGNVFLSTPEETASGTKGIYDVEHQEIHLDSNVVLTKGQNVLKGDHLTYNFETGKSVLTGGAQQTTSTSGKARVRALFVPGSDKGKAKTK